MSRRKAEAQADSPDDYEVVGVSRGRTPGAVVSVRLKPEEIELLTALSEVGGRTLSETLRLGLRCLGQQPALASGGRSQPPRLDTRATTLVIENTAQPLEWSQPNAARPALVR